MSAANTSVTIAIPTYNRERWLKETLESLAAHRHLVPELEILVVDNKSTDGTAAMTKAFMERVEPQSGTTWRYLLETMQGASHARNRSVREARGSIIVFLDDDVLLQPGWLDALLEPWKLERDADIGAIGGEVIPVFPEGCPEWLEGWMSPLRLRDSAGPLDPQQMPMSANLAVLKSVYEEVGGMRGDLGRNGEKLLAGEESEMIKRIRRAGWAIWYAPEAVVEHQFPLTRLNCAYAWRYSRESAQSRVIEMVHASGLPWGKRFSYCLSRFISNVVKVALLLVTIPLLRMVGKGGKSNKCLVRLARSLGYIRQTAWEFPGLLLGR